MKIVENSHTLTVAELPAHTHGRGTQEIWGNLGWLLSILDYPSGKLNAGVDFNQPNNSCQCDSYGFSDFPQRSVAKNGYYNLNFLASRSWSGTSESIGSNTAFEILPPYKVAYCFRRLV